jgi:YgiT-type zinc finger domain-containing protein
MQYGLLSAGDDTTTDNGGIVNAAGEIKHAVVFVLSGLPASWVISNVSFQYGTGLTEPNVPGQVCETCGNTEIVPVPAAAWLFGSALACLGLLGMRRRRGGSL